MVIAKPSNWLSEPETIQIPSAATESATFNMAGRHPVGVFMSPAWTAAALRFQVAFEDGGALFDLRDDAEAIYEITTPVAGDYMQLNPRLFRGARYVRLLSSVAQAADRDLLVMFAEPNKNF